MIRAPRLERAEQAPGHWHEERVRFGDTDAAGIVYYAQVFHWFEAGRSEMLRAFELPYTELVEPGSVMPVVESWARYVTPARYDDALRIETWVHEIKSATVLVAHRIWRDDVLIAEGAARLAHMNGAGRALRLPAALRARLEEPT